MTSTIHNSSTNLNPSDYNNTAYKLVEPAKLDFAENAISGHGTVNSSTPLVSRKVTKNTCFTDFINKIRNFFKKIFPCFFKKDLSIDKTSSLSNSIAPIDASDDNVDMRDGENFKTPVKPKNSKRLADQAARAAVGPSPMTAAFSRLTAVSQNNVSTSEEHQDENKETFPIKRDASSSTPQDSVNTDEGSTVEATQEKKVIPSQGYFDPNFM